MAGEPVQVRSKEEMLMLLGAAKDPAHAKKLLDEEERQKKKGGGGDSGDDEDGGEEQVIDLDADGEASTEDDDDRDIFGGQGQLYPAIEAADRNDVIPYMAKRKLAHAFFRFQDAIAADHREESVIKVLNATRDFFYHGVRPLRGIDAIDQMLHRKETVLEMCGNATDHKIFFDNRVRETKYVDCLLPRPLARVNDRSLVFPPAHSCTAPRFCAHPARPTRVRRRAQFPSNSCARCVHTS